MGHGLNWHEAAAHPHTPVFPVYIQLHFSMSRQWVSFNTPATACSFKLNDPQTNSNTPSSELIISKRPWARLANIETSSRIKANAKFEQFSDPRLCLDLIQYRVRRQGRTGVLFAVKAKVFTCRNMLVDC